MNYSQAVKGRNEGPAAIRGVQSQAETELNRKLTNEEEGLLFKQIDPDMFLENIQKVFIPILYIQPFINNSIISMDMDTSSSNCSCARDLSSCVRFLSSRHQGMGTV